MQKYCRRRVHTGAGQTLKSEALRTRSQVPGRALFFRFLRVLEIGMGRKKIVRWWEAQCVVVYLPCAAAFAAGTEIATESGCVQTAVPLVRSRRRMVILRLPRSTSTRR
jgi:hypothetical protein